MKNLMIALMISGVALMAQTGSAPASPSSNAGSSNAAPTAKVKKHHHSAKKNAAPAATTNNATPNAAPATK